MLSVIISAFDQHDLTAVHVRECMNSSLVPDEIIVVNDGGTPDLIDKLKALKINTKIIYARINESIDWNYTGARNLGVWLSMGDYLSIEDNDHIPHVDYYKEAIETLNDNPKVDRIKSHKRFVIDLKDILKNPKEDWKPVSTRPAHQDVTIIKREVYLKLKGYDERFAGAYGWCATDWKRRTNKIGILTADAGYQYVVNTPATRGLSSRNWKMAREQKEIQSPHGILNFTYSYKIL